MEKRMISEILDSIKGLTVKELLELTKACEEEFGVSAAVQTVIPKDPKPPVKKTEFDVVREAKEFVESAPKIIKEGVSIEEAEALKAKLEELGAKITLK